MRKVFIGLVTGLIIALLGASGALAQQQPKQRISTPNQAFPGCKFAKCVEKLLGQGNSQNVASRVCSKNCPN